jgi:CHAD domain-containing protein
MERAFDRPSDESFHEWRKRVKYLRYQMEALRALWPTVVGGLESSLNDLAETLGEEHDLAELAVYTVVNGQSCTDAERRLLGALVAKRRRELQDEAAMIGHRVYAETPRQFTGRIGAYWDTWRRS